MTGGDPEDELLLSFTWDDVAPRIFKLFKFPTLCFGIGVMGGWMNNALTGRSRDSNMLLGLQHDT